ncbi:hypothetical protein I7I51_01171 [Histoplasma capsulatum]|uniref:Uncharacterized protein n=1 Tax=Ajellomyces capsulatus TaxID=5037 RepID=A0A8A1MDU0_AJECA|nr:hypothetical protein I7I51_01171 [Histoplasma capsulatum]
MCAKGGPKQIDCREVTKHRADATYTPEPTAPFSPDTTASSAKSNNSGGDDATRTTNAPTISTDLSSAETVLRSTKDVTITVPPPTASTTAANAPLNSASATGRSPMANGLVGSLVVAFVVEICFLVLFGMD